MCSFFFSVKVLLLLLLRAAAAAHNISTEAERGTGYSFLLLSLRYEYCCFLCVYYIAVAAAEKGCMPVKTNKTYISFESLVAELLLLFTHREGGDENNKTGFCFSFDTGAQSIAFSVTGYVLLLSHSPRFLLTTSVLKQRESNQLLFLPPTFLFFTLRCLEPLLLLLFLAASISVIQTAMRRLWLLTSRLLRRDACWKNKYC